MTKTKIGVAIVSAGLLIYFWLTLQRAWIMITEDSLVAKGIGLALFALPLVGAWTLVRELMFGAQTEKLADVLKEEGGLPPDNLPRTPAGRIERAAADAEFEKYRADVDQAPDEWRHWFRLSCAYDAAGDRKRARASMRWAIHLAKSGTVTI